MPVGKDAGNGNSQIQQIQQNNRIEEMYRDKQERIARQIALKEARETVSINPIGVVKDPEVLAGKVIKVAEIYYRWINGGGR